MTYGQIPFGLTDVQLYAAGATPGTAVPLPRGRVLELSPTEDEVELTGYNGVVATEVTRTGADVRLEYGGITFGVLAKITGQTVTTSGTTPNVIDRLKQGSAGVARPYVRIVGKALGTDGGDAWMDIKQVKFNLPSGNFNEGEFYISALTGRAVRDANGDLYEFLQHETPTTVSAPA